MSIKVLGRLRFKIVETVFQAALISTQLNHIQGENVKFSFYIFHTLLHFKNLGQCPLPDRLSIERACFQSLNAGIKPIQPRIHGVEPRIHGIEPRIHGVEPRKHSLFERAFVRQVSRAFFAHSN